MTIGEGISQGATKAFDRMEAARQFDASLAEKRRAADQKAFVALANSPRARVDNSSSELAERQRQFNEGLKLRNEELAQRQRQFDAAHSWDDVLNRQKLDTERTRQEESLARMAHYQELEAQTRQKAADLKNARHTAVKDMFWMARNNGGYLTSPELLSEFTKRFEAQDLAGITTAGFFYNADGTVKTPDNDDNKPAMFGISYNYVDPQTGKIAIDQNGRRAERVLVPKFQDEWIAEGQFPEYGRRAAFGMSTEQMQKLAKAKQVQGDTLKDRIAALSAIKSFMMSSDDPTKFNADLDENTLAQLKAAYANGIQGIASQFASAQPKAGGNALTLNKDGTLTLSNGKTLRPYQEYTNPKDGAKYIWKGGGVGLDSFEAIKTGDNAAQQRQRQPGEGNQTMTDPEFSTRRAHQAQYYGKILPGYELEGDEQLAQQADPTQNENVANAPGGSQGGNGGDMEKMFNALKAKGIINKDMTLDQFVALREEEENGGGE